MFLVDRLELEDQAKKAFIRYLKNDFTTVVYKEHRDEWRKAEIQVKSDKRNGSQFAFFDVEEERKGKHVRLAESMARYVVEDFGPTAADMQGNLRRLFETVLKTKYCLPLSEAIKQKEGLGKLLKRLFDAKILNDDLKSPLFNLCNLSSCPHHGQIIDASSRELSRDEMIPLVREALELVHKV